jgi:L-histidine N-alpha-methyltransferase
MADGVGAPALQVDVYIDRSDRRLALRADVLAGLTATPKALPPKWFYDAWGSTLFEDITRLPEYYLTSRERAILRAHAGEIAELTRANTLVELGSGSSEKTRLLLDAMVGAGHLRRFVPFDVSEPALRESAARIADEYRGIEVHGVVGDFERHIEQLPAGHRRLVAFLGSSIGNLVPEERSRFLAELRDYLDPGEALLLGTDLVKDVRRLERAYNDSRGVTAEFNRNVLAVINRELHADFDLQQFAHVARFNPEREWIEMFLRSETDQTATIADLGLRVGFVAGEEMQTEISDKFRRPAVEAELDAAGFELRCWWTDPDGEFALSLSFAA